MVPIIMAALTAAAMAAQGIAGAVQNGANLEAQSQNSAENRALQSRLAKQQLAEQQRQFDLAQADAQRKGLLGAYQGAAQTENMLTNRQQADTQALQSTLAKAFLSGGGR